jgi:hypothetical protein
VHKGGIFFSNDESMLLVASLWIHTMVGRLTNFDGGRRHSREGREIQNDCHIITAIAAVPTVPSSSKRLSSMVRILSK